MKTNKIILSKEYNLTGGVLNCYVCDSPFCIEKEGWKRPAVVVLPGGGYAQVCAHEGEPIALQFVTRGFHAFVLEYDCLNEYGYYPTQLIQLACAVDYIKKHAQEYNVNPDEIFVVGFSAGGHLAGNLSTDYMQAISAYGAPLDCKVTAAGLCYPVISNVYKHVGSFENLTKNRSTQEEKEEVFKKIRLDENVCERTAPAFIWSTAEDTVVPPINAISYAAQLSKNKIKFELHVYPQGEHGLASCNKELNGDVDYLFKPIRWFDDCAAFFRLFVTEIF